MFSYKKITSDNGSDPAGDDNSESLGVFQLSSRLGLVTFLSGHAG